jgi:raffinose/stachyose/melibiose transport system permease protein
MTIRMNPVSRVIKSSVLLLATVVALLPVGLMLLNSFKTNAEVSVSPLALPQQWLFSNYTTVWAQADLGQAMLSSLIVSGSTIILICTTASMAAYVLARKAVKGWKIVTLWLLATTTIPIQLFIFPLYFIFAQLGFVANRIAVAFIYTALFGPFSIFLLRSYFMNVPTDMEECARVDGANNLQVFTRILLPMVFPGVLTVALVVGLYSWNEFLVALTFLKSRGVETIVVRFYSMQGQFTSSWGQLMAAAGIIIFPVLAFFVFLQGRFIEGMTAGSVKG